jgi:NADH-quinone oxidoreductase subunit N
MSIYAEMLRLATPELIVVLGALTALATDLLTLRELEVKPRWSILLLLSSLTCIIALAWIAFMPVDSRFMGGMLVVNPFTRIVKGSLLILTLFALSTSSTSSFSEHWGEFMALILFATAGMMLLVSTEDILMIFASLELTSLCLYVLTAFDKQNPKSAEAALKYFFFGGLSAAITLFGLSFLYGIAHSTNLRAIAEVIQNTRPDGLIVLALVMTVAGFAFKVAAAPFHFWAPDVYEGAPVTSAGFISSASKIAGFVVLAAVVLIGFADAASGRALDHRSGWGLLLMFVAAASMIVGNLAAIVQRSVRRLLAYSAIAHGGYLLLAILSGTPGGQAALVYYVITYALTALGAFAAIGLVQRATQSDELTAFAGLSRRSPVLSFCLLVFMLSLAGIPPLAGFFGKFYVFTSALEGQPSLSLLWLVILALAMSAVSLYYYLQVLKQIYVISPHAPDGLYGFPPSQGRIGGFELIPICLLAAAVIILGCLPGCLLTPLLAAVNHL